MGRYLTHLVIALAATTAAPMAYAQTDKAGAEVLFKDAMKLTEAQKYEEACPKLAESLRLYPSVNTIYYLADCYEHVGKTASAWIHYLEAAERARAAGEAAKEAKARERASKIEPKVAHLTITIAEPMPDLEVRRDATLVGKAQWGTAMPVDPGEHAIEARAPGKQVWSAKVVIKGDGAKETVLVPKLVDVAAGAPVVPPTAPPIATTTTTTPTPSTEPAPDAASGIGSGQRTTGLVVAGAGVLALGVGGYLALSAKSTFNDSAAHCRGSLCDQEGVDLRAEAYSRGNIATIVVIGGAAAVAVGGVLWLAAPKVAPSASVGVVPGGIILRGAF